MAWLTDAQMAELAVLVSLFKEPDDASPTD